MACGRIPEFESYHPSHAVVSSDVMTGVFHGALRAFRRLVELGLAGSQPMKRRSPKAAAKATDLAGKEIDALADSSATHEEWQQRKPRLLKGPREFRDIRGDLAKPKR
jgi:hypothetical protein